LEERMARPGFWDRQEEARQVIDRSRQIKSWTEPWESLLARIDELDELRELLADADDDDLAAEFAGEARAIGRDLDELELRNMLRGPDAHRDALLTVHPGAGGTESQDWAEMLVRMYTRYAEKCGWKVEVLEAQAGEEAGLKSASLEIRGENAYGYLGAENGIHRLVRISPFDAQGRRHTSFASVFVYPVVDADIEIEIDESELRIDTYRASGAGGQHVNKTDSAVRITHEPTGIVVACQQERSQHKNKAKAMKMLKAALYQRALEEQDAERQKLEDTKSDIAWGNQIRSYVLQPYTMVKDHRTDVEVGNANGVLDGDLNPFIEAFLRQKGGARA
ncbi:MAG: peptide chain release factor 2, partial [Gemmatimonadota bacterium]